MIDIQQVKGDIIEFSKNNGVEAIGHGCNCFHAQGSGVAKAIMDWSNGLSLQADKKYSLYGDMNKLGTYTSFDVNGIMGYNLYTQYVHAGMVPKNTSCLVHWKSVIDAVCSMILQSNFTTYAIPMIGTGLARGSRDEFLADVLERIECNVDEFIDRNVTLYVVEL